MPNITEATIADLKTLAALFDEYRLFYHKNSDISGAENFLKERLEKGDSKIFLAKENNQTVGFTQLFPIFSSTRMKRYWLLNDLFVNEIFRGKGHSKRLLEAAKNWAVATKSCGILLETDKTNLIGNQLYPSCGFKLYDHANFYEWTPANENKISE